MGLFTCSQHLKFRFGLYLCLNVGLYLILLKFYSNAHCDLERYKHGNAMIEPTCISVMIFEFVIKATRIFVTFPTVEARSTVMHKLRSDAYITARMSTIPLRFNASIVLVWFPIPSSICFAISEWWFSVLWCYFVHGSSPSHPFNCSNSGIPPVGRK